MSTVGKAPKKASDHIPFFADQGIEWACGAVGENKVIISGSVALAAGSATVDLLATHGVTMDAADYQIMLSSDGALATWANKAVGSFDISGTGTDNVDYMVIGQLSDMA